MWDLYVYLVLGLLIFFAFTVRVITGFGSAMLLAPLVALFLEPKQAVVYIILLECAIAVVFILKERLNFEVKQIFVGGISGIVAGIVLFGLLAERIVGFIIGVSVLTFSILFLLDIHFRTEKEGLLFNRQLQLSSTPFPNHINLCTPFPCGRGRIRPRLPESLFHTLIKLVIVTALKYLRNEVTLFL